MGFFSKSRRKATAPLVLATWLFALAVNIAHACGVDDFLVHASVEAPVSAGHQFPTGDELPACDQFCAEDIPILGKLKAVEDLSPGSAIVAAISSGGVRVAAFPRVCDALPGRDPPPGIAINTRFVRLAL